MSYKSRAMSAWETVAEIALKLGATEFQIAKWRQRGVPDAWRWRISKAAKENGKRVPEESFERVAPRRNAA